MNLFIYSFFFLGGFFLNHHAGVQKNRSSLTKGRLGSRELAFLNVFLQKKREKKNVLNSKRNGKVTNDNVTNVVKVKDDNVEGNKLVSQFINDVLCDIGPSFIYLPFVYDLCSFMLNGIDDTVKNSVILSLQKSIKIVKELIIKSKFKTGVKIIIEDKVIEKIKEKYQYALNQKKENSWLSSVPFMVGTSVRNYQDLNALVLNGFPLLPQSREAIGLLFKEKKIFSFEDFGNEFRLLTTSLKSPHRVHLLGEHDIVLYGSQVWDLCIDKTESLLINMIIGYYLFYCAKKDPKFLKKLMEYVKLHLTASNKNDIQRVSSAIYNSYMKNIDFVDKFIMLCFNQLQSIGAVGSQGRAISLKNIIMHDVDEIFSEVSQEKWNRMSRIGLMVGVTTLLGVAALASFPALGAGVKTLIGGVQAYAQMGFGSWSNFSWQRKFIGALTFSPFSLMYSLIGDSVMFGQSAFMGSPLMRKILPVSEGSLAKSLVNSFMHIYVAKKAVSLVAQQIGLHSEILGWSPFSLIKDKITGMIFSHNIYYIFDIDNTLKGLLEGELMLYQFERYILDIQPGLDAIVEQYTTNNDVMKAMKKAGQIVEGNILNYYASGEGRRESKKELLSSEL